MSRTSVASTSSQRRLVQSRLAIFGLVGLVAIICGRLAATHYAPHVIAVIVVVPILVVVVKRPLLNVMLLLAVVASIFSYGSLPRLGLPGNPPINIADVLLLMSVGGAAYRRPWREWPPAVRRYAWVLLLTLLLASVATAKTALLGSTQAREALFAYRNFLYLAIALVVALELSGKQWHSLLDAVISYGALISAVSIAATLSPSVAHHVATLSAQSIASSVESFAATGTTRIRLAGLYFVYSTCVLTLVYVLLVQDRWRRLRAVALLLMVGAIGVSLNRDMYAGVLLAVGVTVLLGGARIRYAVGIGTIAVVAATAVFVITSLGSVGGIGVTARASTLLEPSQLVESSSLQDRAYEYSRALPSIAAHPWLGVGPRQFYGAYLGQGEERPVRFFVQDLYVDQATDYGIPTALAFLLLPAICLFFGLTRIRFARNSLDRALLAAAIGTLLALLVSCLVGTFVQSPESTVAFGTACGFILAAGSRTYTSRTDQHDR
jgi:O-Antigen ligase